MSAGVPVGVSVSPVIPFLNEPELERILEAAAAAGASRAFSIVLRLPWEVNPLFQQWLQQHYPDRAARVMARVREMRGGRDNDARFGSRMRGQGLWAELLRQRFDKACARLGLNRERIELDLSRFRRPAAEAAQASLFCAYLNRSFTRSAQLFSLGEWRSPPLRNDSSSSFSSLRWCSVSFTGVSTAMCAYRSPG